MSAALDALRPCPFCGEEVMRRDALWPSEGDTDAVIHAAPSDCPMQVFSDHTWGGSLYGRWNGGIDASASVTIRRFLDAVENSQQPISHDAMQTLRKHLRAK